MKVSILIVSGDLNHRFAKRCLASVKKHTPAELVQEMLVIEAGISPDFNHAAEINKALRTFTGDALVMLDDDVTVRDGWLQGLIDCAAENDDVGIVGCVHEDKRGAINHSGAVATEACFGKPHTDAITRPRICPYVCSATMLITRKAWETIGAFDESFRKYGQDVDYCLRAWESGFKVVCTNKARVTHLVGATIGARGDLESVLAEDQRTLADRWRGNSMYRHFHLARRGVSYPTFACDIKCCFCYYHKVTERAHRPLAEVKAEMDRLRTQYKLRYVDISGGEPTVYPSIAELVEHCSAIGLLPTIITNGQRPDVIEKLIPAGLEDVVVSIHGHGEDCDRAMAREGAFDAAMRTAEMLNERGFGFRTNTTLISHNYKNLGRLADRLVEIKPRMSNLNVFNPHEGTDWSQDGRVDFQARYSELAPYVKEAIDRLMAAGIWVNVRYMPLCLLRGYEKHVCNQHQCQWDPYEREYLSGLSLSEAAIKKTRRAAKRDDIFGESREDTIHTWITKKKICKRNVFYDSCEACANREICDGVYPQYARQHGPSEFEAVGGFRISDPLHYRRRDISWSVLKPEVSRD